MTDISNRVTPWLQKRIEGYGWLDEMLLKQTATEKEFQPAWQPYKYLLRGKMYAYIGINDKSMRPILTLKLEPQFSDMLQREYGGDIVPGYYMNKLHWSSVYLDGNVPQSVIVDMIQASHKLVLATLTKKAQREILKQINP